MGLDRICPIKNLSKNVASSERGFSRELIGSLFRDDALGGGVYKLVYCGIGDVTAGNVVQNDVSVTSANASFSSSFLAIEPCAASGFPVGVAACDFVSASYGLIQVAGLCSSVLQGSDTAEALQGLPCVVGATAGNVITADLTTASHAARLVGMVVSSASDSGAALVINLRGVL